LGGPRFVNYTVEELCIIDRSGRSVKVIAQATATTGPKRATRASPVAKVPRLPHKVKVDVTKCHACHTEWKSMPCLPYKQPGREPPGAGVERIDGRREETVWWKTQLLAATMREEHKVPSCRHS
jgi:hypothetical protein